MASKIEIAGFLKNVKSRFPRFTLNESVLSDYASEFERTSEDVLYAALKEYLREEKTTPGFSDIRRKVLKLNAGSLNQKLDDFDKKKYREWYQEKIDDGFVFVNRGTTDDPKDNRWIEKDRAIFYNGKWYAKIDHCMNILGSEKVTAILKSELKVMEQDFSGKGAAPTKTFWKLKQYPALLEEMLNLCKAPEVW